MTDPDDILARRLRAANPVPPDQPVRVDRQIPELLEAAMSVSSDTTPHSPKRPHRWRLAAAAAVVLAIAATIGGFVATRGADSRQSAMHLRLPAGTSMGSCMPFSQSILTDMEVAFSGTATEVVHGVVTLEVDHWYRGGDAQQVSLVAPDPATVSLEGGLTFTAGTRYLVTATNGTVNFCGYTVAWTSDLESVFDAAFTR